MRLWPTTTENKWFENNNNNVMNVAFLSNKKKVYSDSKNEDIVKILWYFIVFLNFIFNIIKLDEPKFTTSHTKSILIFSLLESRTCAANASINCKEKSLSLVTTYNINAYTALKAKNQKWIVAV